MCTEVAPWMYNLPESVTFTPLSSAWPSPSAASSLFRANIPCSLVPPHILQAHGVNARMKLLCQRRAACPKGCWRKHVMGDELRHSRPPEIKIFQVCWIGVLVYREIEHTFGGVGASVQIFPIDIKHFEYLPISTSLRA